MASMNLFAVNDPKSRFIEVKGIWLTGCSVIKPRSSPVRINLDNAFITSGCDSINIEWLLIIKRIG